MDYDNDPHDFFDEEIVSYHADFKEKYDRRKKFTISTDYMINNLSYLIHESHALVLWLDNDLAGENI